MTSLLVVEGNPEVRRMICLLVEGLVGPVYECEDPARVAELYRQARLDWILIDIRLKQRNGLLATRKIKQLFPEAEIILITDYDDEALRKAAREAGADHYVVKERLIELVELFRSRMRCDSDER